jgi:uncharacterized protein DUF4440
MTNTVRPDVRAFFERYQSAGDSLDSAALADCFTDVILNLDPSSAAAVPRQAIVAALPRRRQLFDSIGCTGSELREIEETPLDDMHTLVATSWAMRRVEPAAPLTLRSTFLLRREDGTWRIALYLNHQDIASLVKENQ